MAIESALLKLIAKMLAPRFTLYKALSMATANALKDQLTINGFTGDFYIGDNNGSGIVCCESETDNDNDLICSGTDNCPNVANPNQEDADNDDIGDVCDADTVYGTISGYVQEGVSLNIDAYSCGTGETVATMTTNAEGYYAFGGLENGKYGIYPQNANYIFSPTVVALEIPQTNIQPYDFTASEIHSISGTVTGDVQEGVSVSIYRNECGSNTLLDTVTTDSNGNYTFTSILKGAYTVTPIKTGYTFSPANQSVTVSSADKTGVDFTAVATVQPFMPIAICEDSILSDGQYDCNIGRVFNDNTDTARWTNFEGCGGAVNSSDVSRLIDCDAGANPDPIGLGGGIATTNGIISTASHRVHDCFFGDGTEPPRILEWTLPVIECDSAPTCGVVVGTVNVDIVWITESIDPAFYNAPTELWSADGEALLWQYADNGTNGEARWADFVVYFNLQDVVGGAAPYSSKSIYFKPSCDDVDFK